MLCIPRDGLERSFRIYGSVVSSSFTVSELGHETGHLRQGRFKKRGKVGVGRGWVSFGPRNHKPCVRPCDSWPEALKPQSHKGLQPEPRKSTKPPPPRIAAGPTTCNALNTQRTKGRGVDQGLELHMQCCPLFCSSDFEKLTKRQASGSK